ncbi:diguanylate cyclase [Pseudodesulfovibrio sp. JC047]|uniref:GGDEF domain-containing protein n=1 Tax=Pseudodesulfovibrio sp. JC047 TaxID=2683199 RepID=UPI0013D25207|nr:GGDEF domain-containing protein [Pseudodesulfovibrio sp. JC047]NDV19189.1 diguanylate cyclase [Pseudodesulfovibrio sp. JC047]
MPKEKKINFSEQALVTELSELQKQLRCLYQTHQPCPETNGICIFRLLENCSQERWNELAAKHDLRQWMTIPLEKAPFPHLENLQKTLEKLAYQTDHDPLTGVANRRAFDRILDIEIERSKRAKTPLSLAIFDLDDFKLVNDTYGHSKGDEVLTRFADHLQASTRRYDLAARFGGEEFALILAGSGVVKASQLLQRLLHEFEQIEFQSADKKKSFNVTCSVGFTCFKGAMNVTDKDLVNLADEALYEAKTAGKNQVKVSRLPFVDDVPNETLVQANEKQFLFGGK